MGIGGLFDDDDEEEVEDEVGDVDVSLVPSVFELF
jgi:hypothetical protein